MLCEICGKNYTITRYKNYCTQECRVKKNNKELLLKVGQEEFDQMVECKICGLKSNCLSTHLVQTHKIKGTEYKEKYGGEIQSEKYKKQSSERFKGDKNPIHKLFNKQEISPFSKHFYLKRGFSEEEAIKKAEEKVIETKGKRKRENNSRTIEYWLLKCNGDIEKAKEALSNSQKKFSLEICIEKFGEVEGKKRWQERQDKWIATLDKKTEEEKLEINRKKGWGGSYVYLKEKYGEENAKAIISSRMVKCSYSNVSQELFIKIYNIIGEKFGKVYFAINHIDGVYDNDFNNEYVVETVQGSFRLLDFYIPSLNKCIEFNGLYWHDQKPGGKEREEIREKEILEVMPTLKIFNVKEMDYANDPDKVLQQCLEFLSND